MINKKGMTLVELLVYIVLAALVLTPVVMLVNNSSVNMARDAGRVNLQMSGREILQIIYDDLKNTGFKVQTDKDGRITSHNLTASNLFSGYTKIPSTCKGTTGYIGEAIGFKCTTTIVDTSSLYIAFFSRGPSSDMTVLDPSKNNLPYGCTVPSCTDFVADSSSYYGGNFYLFTAISFTSLTNIVVPSTGGRQVGSGMSYSGYSGMFSENAIKCYDTLGVSMVKLDKDGLMVGTNAYKISYKVRDTTKLVLLRTVIPSSGNPEYSVLARNVMALKFRFSDNLKDWYDYFNKDNGDHVRKRNEIQYIKVILVLRDPKKLSPVNPAPPITLIAAGDGVAGYTKGASGATPALILTPTDQSLYERYEIVVPIPNNGLFP